MTEAEALDMAAKAAGWGSWEYVKNHCDHSERPGIRAHAKTIMENAENARLLSMSAEREINLRGELLRLQRKNAALKAGNEALRALQEGDGELLTIAWMDGAHRSNKAHREQVAALKAENERLREAMTAMHKDLLLRAEIDIRDGTKIVHASNGVWLKFCAALKEIDNGDR